MTSGIVGIDLHYTASSPSTTVEAVAAFQTGPNSQEAFPAIAYTLVVDESGTIHWCHDLDVRCWHNGAPGHNTNYIGICYTGNVAPNEAQLRGMAGAIAWCEKQLGRQLTVGGHKDHYATACPGPEWPAWKDQVT